MLPSSTKRHYEKWQSYGDSIEKQAINNKGTFPDHSSSKHLQEKSITKRSLASKSTYTF